MPNLDKALADMASKLGTKAEVLWPQLVAIQKWNWCIDLFICLFILGVGGILAWFWKRQYKIDKYSDANVAYGIATIALTFVGVTGLIFIIAGIPSHLIYPEIGAVNSLLGK